MIIDDEHRVRIGVAVKQAIDSSAATRTAVPVRKLAESIIEATQSPFEFFDEVLDVICLASIERHLPIEFTRPLVSADRHLH